MVEKSLALVSWDTICQPRDHGELGFQKLQDLNTSFMMKLGFSIAFDSNAFWFSRFYGLSIRFQMDCLKP